MISAYAGSEDIGSRAGSTVLALQGSKGLYLLTGHSVVHSLIKRMAGRKPVGKFAEQVSAVVHL